MDRYIDMLMVTLIGFMIGIGISAYYRSRELLIALTSVFWCIVVVICGLMLSVGDDNGQ